MQTEGSEQQRPAAEVHWRPRPRSATRERNQVFALILLAVAVCVFAIVITLGVLLHYADVYHAIGTS